MLDLAEIRDFYRYRLLNLTRNKIIVRDKLEEEANAWSRFLKLCKRLEVNIDPSSSLT
jgi:hypothetical protein